MNGTNKNTLRILVQIDAKFKAATGRNLRSQEATELIEWLDERPWFIEFDNHCKVTIEP